MEIRSEFKTDKKVPRSFKILQVTREKRRVKESEKMGISVECHRGNQ